MAYDDELAERLRETVAGESAVTEKKMFGGLAFLVAGHLAVAASSEGLLLRIDPAQHDALLEEPRASPCIMQGRDMAGWIRVDADADIPEDELLRWVGHGLAYVHTLPPK